MMRISDNMWFLIVIFTKEKLWKYLQIALLLKLIQLQIYKTWITRAKTNLILIKRLDKQK